MKTFFSNLIKEVKASIERFFPTFCLTVLLFLVSGYMVIFEPEYNVAETLLKIVMTIIFGILLCTLGRVLLEKYYYTDDEKDTRRLIEYVLLFISAFAYLPLAEVDDNPTYILAGYFGVCLALFICIFYAANGQSISKTISYVVKSTVFNGFVCGIVMAGMSLSIYAFDYLIYSFDDVDKVFSIVALFIWIVLFFNLSLSVIPRKDSELKIPNLFKVIVLYAMLPLYLLLISILYIYLGKILITLSFPSGQVNWFASFASLFFVFFFLALEQYRDENKFAGLFVKFGGFIIIPVIAMQFVAMYIRISAYGFTTARYISLTLNMFAFAFAVVSLIKGGKYVKHMLLAAACISLLLTVTPANVFDVPIREQASRLTQTLRRNGMLQDEKIAAKADVSDEDKIKITSAYDYLNSYRVRDKNRPVIIKSIDRGFEQIFGFSPQYDEDDYRRNAAPVPSATIYVSYQHEYDFIDVSGYSKLHHTYSYRYGSEELVFDKNGEAVTFNTKEEARRLYSIYGDSNENVLMEYDINGDKLILTYFSFEINADNEINVNGCKGYFLGK